MINESLVRSKNILLRADLDVPIKDGRVVNDYRLQCLLPTIDLLLKHANKILIIGHLGRPEGIDPAFSLAPVQEWLQKALHQSISFVPSGFSPGEWVRGDSRLTLLENIRFQKGELEIDPQLATDLSADAQIYVYEAFASYNPATTLQRIPEILPTYPGLQFEKEVTNLDRVLKKSAKPSVLLLSGIKDDKKKFIDQFIGKFDDILVGGRLADSVPSVCAPGTCITPAKLTEDGFDINARSTKEFLTKIKKAKTIVLNGPLGRFEDFDHATSTKAILQAIKDAPAFSVLGGGDTLSAIHLLGFKYSDFGFVSTGGGAMLEYLATDSHPLLDIIKATHATNS